MPDESFLKTFADAWNNRDIDAIMNHMAEDGVFISSSEEKFVGAAVVHGVPIGSGVVHGVPLDDRALSVWDAASRAWALQRGTFTVAVGASSRDLRLAGTLVV